jgi:NAD+ kinase
MSELKIAIIAHPKLADAMREAEVAATYLKNKGLHTAHGSIYNEELRRRVKSGEFDMVVAMGGDGTILRAGHLCAPCNIPILGLNKGRLGFLFQIDDRGWEHTLEQVISGDYWIEKRMMLRAEHFRAGESLGTWQAVNDVVIARGAMMRPIHIKASVDNQYLTTYIADGLIAATPTGSTAYAMAAGGPILPPELRNILLVPIAAHLSVDRALVLSEGATVSITVISENSIMSIDGQTPIGMDENDRVDVRAGENTVQFIRFGELDYFYRNLTAHMNQNSMIGLPR